MQSHELHRNLPGLELVVVTALWLVAWAQFADGPVDRMYRIDRGAAVAYPSRDALDAYGSALAVLVGDGWANWESSSRWTLCKVGWKALLVPLAWLFDRDPARMQHALTFLLASTGPAFYFLVRQLLPEHRGRTAASAATLLFLFSPLEGAWSFQRSMMTEGPTLVFSLLVCALALRAVRRGSWHYSAAVSLGLLSGVLVLVRSQTRLSLAALAALVGILAWNRPGGRRFLAAVTLSAFAVLGPVYLKTSYHLGRLYLGTEICSVRAVLNWTPCGQAVGGTGGLPTISEAREGEVLDALNDRARAALAVQLEHPLAPAKAAVERFLYFTYSPLLQLIRGPWRVWLCFPAVLLLACGIASAWPRLGPGALIPVAYATCYLLPNALFSLYWSRHGAPISWLGIAYTAAIPYAFVSPRRGVPDRPSGEASARPLVWLTAACALWAAVCTSWMLHVDLAPFSPVDWSAVASRPEMREALGGEAADSASVHVAVGHLLLPMEVAPNDPPFRYDEETLLPRAEVYSTFFLVRAWKENGGFSRRRLWIRGRLPAGLRNGDRVVVVMGDIIPGEVLALVEAP